MINTGTTIAALLIGLPDPQGQNKGRIALHLKLNELPAARHNASNRMISIEDLDEQDLKDMATFCARLAEREKHGGAVKERHSIDKEGMQQATATTSRAPLWKTQHGWAVFLEIEGDKRDQSWRCR